MSVKLGRGDKAKIIKWTEIIHEPLFKKINLEQNLSGL